MTDIKAQITRIRLQQLIRPTQIQKIYFKKGIVYGKYLDEHIYPKTQFSHPNQRLDYTKKMKSERNEFSLHRTRQNIYHIVHANVGEHGDYVPTFVTLTFRDNVTSLKQAQRDFKYFITKLNQHLDYKSMYLCVPEIQQKREQKYGKGVWHFHVVFFNHPYIPVLKLKELWGHGNVDVQLAGSIKNIGAYIAKYLSKDTFDSRLYGQRAYNTSRGLLRPVHLFDESQIDQLTGRATMNMLKSKKLNHKTINIWKQN